MAKDQEVAIRQASQNAAQKGEIFRGEYQCGRPDKSTQACKDSHTQLEKELDSLFLAKPNIK
jgi:hypothetical protein